jgi:YidC/Oxa1 family membrane protein insertase
MLLLSGVSLCILFLLYSLLNPREVTASTSDSEPTTAATRTHDYGYFEPVARPLEWTLREVNTRVMSKAGRSRWGWTIVFTTFLVNLLLLPFRILAARNARLMKRLKPELDVINARYKASGTKMNPAQSTETAELYRKHGVHPLGGCIPMLGPWIVLIAFYRVLNSIAELHGAHWLWINDLSSPEQLPVRVLPLLLIATQWLLAKMTPTPDVDPTTAKLMMFTPVIFGVIFYRQPSALLIYWLTGNVLAIAQQWWLAKHYQ